MTRNVTKVLLKMGFFFRMDEISDSEKNSTVEENTENGTDSVDIGGGVVVDIPTTTDTIIETDTETNKTVLNQKFLSVRISQEGNNNI